MKRLITVEEHFISAAMNEKIASIFRANGQEPKKQTLRQNIAEKVVSLGKDRITYMDSVGVSAQLISYAGEFPGRMEPRYALPLCREVNHEMYEAAKLYPGEVLSPGAPADLQSKGCIGGIGVHRKKFRLQGSHDFRRLCRTPSGGGLLPSDL